MLRIVNVACCLGSILLVAAAVGAAQGEEEQKGKAMSYGEVRDFLSQHTKIVELKDDSGTGVVVTPDWQGRVMTSTCGGDGGPSFGFVNSDYIKEGKIDLHMNAYGAEERLWFCPEGGQYSLWFKPGDEQVMKKWFTPPAFNEGGWKVVTEPRAGDQRVVMAVNMKFGNASAAKFDIDVTRQVNLLGADEFKKLFGATAADLVGKSGVKMVAYQTVNEFTNRGDDFSKEKGLISMWILGMMNAGPKAVIIAPYKTGSEAELGPVVKSDYFGSVPADRLKVTPEAVLFRADNKYRSKIGISQRRVRNVLGSIDFGSKVLTLVSFSMPEDPTSVDYLNNMWQLPQKEPYVGDVANAYNDGPNDLGKQMGAFYEIESVSPAKVLKTGESLSHTHRTIHIQADMDTLKALAKETLGVDLDKVQAAMLTP
jgi:hypothetical protein